MTVHRSRVWGRYQSIKRKDAEATAAEIVTSIDKAESDGIVKLEDIVQGPETWRVVAEIKTA